MNVTFDELNEVKSFDVIFVGHLASVAADLFASLTKDHYRSLVLKPQKIIVQTSLLPLYPDQIQITKRIKRQSVQIKQLKILSIKPISKQIQVEGGKIYQYKYLVYSGNVEEWVDYSAIKTLPQALSNQYSLVYSNMKKRDLSVACSQISSGNIVFYVPKGSHSGYDNFNFLCVYEKLKDHLKSKEDHAKPLNFKIILQGTDFFPHSQEADNLIKREIHERGIEVTFNSKLTKIDYLRRTLTINEKNEIAYNLLYCVVPQKLPNILKAAQIDAYQNNPRTLQNKRFKNIFVYGGDVFPTTHTFEAVQYQTHCIVKNLEHLLKRNGQISIYKGVTKIPIYLSTRQVLEVVHYYSKKQRCELDQHFSPIVSQKCSWISMAINKLTKSYLAQLYYNYSSYGAPYYVFSPALGSVKLLQEEKIVDCSGPIVTANHKKLFTHEDGQQTRINRTDERVKPGINVLKG